MRIGDKLYWCAGALAQIYEQEGGRVTYPGKPHAAIYELAYEKLRALGMEIDKTRLLAIGDSPKTDMRGALAQNIDGLYVGTGLAEHSVEGDSFEREVRALLGEHDVSATYAQSQLHW